jgi:hypothetical protein
VAAPPDQAALRAEHDALAERLAARASVDLVKEGGVRTFFAVISLGMTAKLAWDRWGWIPRRRLPPPGLPLWFLLAGAATLVLAALAASSFLRARRLQRQELADFARLRALRGRLGLES